MNLSIALIGASGRVGRRILEEALSRGHRVTAVVRDPAKLATRPGLTVARGDAGDPAGLAAAIAGHDAVVSAVSPAVDDPAVREKMLAAYRGIVSAAKAAKAPRLLVVGGAGTLDVGPGAQLVDAPGFPPQWREAARGIRDVHAQLLRPETALDWVFFAPSPLLDEGPRTGRYALGGESVLPGKDGAPARISDADYAVALVDELERPRHSRARFTAAAA
jgi:putative NADH-flavin reductase